MDAMPVDRCGETHDAGVQPRRRATRGLTLIELAIVLAVVAIVGAVAAPSYTAFVDARRLDAAAVALAADIQLARREAVARHQPLQLSARTDAGATCWVLHTGAPADCSCGAGTEPVCSNGAHRIVARRLDAGERLRVEANVGSMRFDPLHGTVTPAGTWRVVDPRGRSVQHVVNVLGRTRSCSPAGALPGWKPC